MKEGKEINLCNATSVVIFVSWPLLEGRKKDTLVRTYDQVQEKKVFVHT